MWEGLLNSLGPGWTGMKRNETQRTMAKRGVPEGLWIRCPQCKATVFRKEVESRLNVCPECEYHFYLPAASRIAQLLDQDSFEEWFTDLSPCDPLQFKDRIPYAERIQAEQAKTGMRDAAVVGRGFVRGRPVVFGVTDFAFMAGSMGSVVGEKLTRAAEEATRLLQVTGGEIVSLQGVQGTFHFSERFKLWPDDDHRSRLVCIGRDLNEAQLRASLQAFHLPAGSDPYMALPDFELPNQRTN